MVFQVVAKVLLGVAKVSKVVAKVLLGSCFRIPCSCYTVGRQLPWCTVCSLKSNYTLIPFFFPLTAEMHCSVIIKYTSLA